MFPALFARQANPKGSLAYNAPPHILKPIPAPIKPNRISLRVPPLTGSYIMK